MGELSKARLPKRKYLPLARNAFESMRTALEECESGPGNQISYRAGNQNLTRWSQRSDPGTHVHGESRDSRGKYFDFSRVHACPHRDSEVTGAFPDR